MLRIEKLVRNNKYFYLKSTLILLFITIMLIGCGKKYRIVILEQFDGTISLLRENSSEEVYEGMNLIADDEVHIDDSSAAAFLVDSDKHIVASENTAFKISATGNEKSGLVKIDLLYGESLYTIDNKLEDESGFEVTTPNATLAVRGTTFRVNYDDIYNITDVEVIEGKVWVSVGEQETVLEAGDYVSVWGEDLHQYPNGVKPSDRAREISDNSDYKRDDNESVDNVEILSDWKTEYQKILDDPADWLESNVNPDYSTGDLRYQYSLIDIYEDSVPELILYVYGDTDGNGRYYPFYVATYDNGSKYLCGDYMEINSKIGVIDDTPCISSISNGDGSWSIYSIKLGKNKFSVGSEVTSGDYKSIETMWSEASAVAEYIDINNREIFNEFN